MQRQAAGQIFDFMTLNLGKLLFPRLHPDQRRREMRNLRFALLAGLAIAGITAMVMIMLGKAKLRRWLGGLRRCSAIGGWALKIAAGGFLQKNHIAPGLFAGQ